MCLKNESEMKTSWDQKGENFQHENHTNGNAKGSPSSRRKKTPDENWKKKQECKLKHVDKSKQNHLYKIIIM